MLLKKNAIILDLHLEGNIAKLLCGEVELGLQLLGLGVDFDIM